MEHVTRDMDYVSGSDFEDELLGFPSTLDSDPLPSQEDIQPLEEVNSAPSPAEEDIQPGDSVPAPVEVAEIADIPGEGPWKVSGGVE